MLPFSFFRFFSTFAFGSVYFNKQFK